MRGLSLSGGGIKAAAHIGALKAFEEEKIKFDCVSGASSGSIIATMYALGYSSDEMWKLFKKYYKKIKYVEWKQVIKMILGLIFTRRLVIDGLNSGKVIEKIINEICKKSYVEKMENPPEKDNENQGNSDNNKNINEIKMPLMISMVDLQKGTVYIASSQEKRKVLQDNTKYISDIPIATAVRASCSFPVVFSPCKFDGLQLIDGGTRENLPWKGLKEYGADEVYGIAFDTILEKNQCCKNMIEVAARAMELQGRELANYEKEGIDHLITICLKKVALLDSNQIDVLYKMGYEETKKKLNLLKKSTK